MDFSVVFFCQYGGVPTRSVNPATTPPAVHGFRARVRAETLPTSFIWHRRDSVALLAVPALFAAGWLGSLLTQDPAVGTTVDTSVRIALFVVLAVANRELLARHWRAFWAAPWRSIGVVLAGLVVIQIVISALGNALRPFVDTLPVEQAQATSLTFAVMLFASFNPVVTALIEDFTYRHTLLLKFPVWNRFTIAAALTIGNALVFGATHINNFGGQWLLTLSYAGAGLVMNLTYLWTRNIWHVLLMHGLNNFILGGPIAFLLVYALGADMNA